MEGSKPVDHPDRETVAVRQGTGPRATVSVLLISLTLAAVVGVALVAYFVYTFLVPTAFGLLADSQQWFKDLQPWIDMQFAQSGLFIFQTSLTGEQWVHIGVSSFIWLVTPLLIGLRLVVRAEVK